MNYNTILSLFGLDPNNFKHVLEEPYDKDGTFTMFVEQRADKQPCPYCNSEKIFIKDYNDVTV